ncbi:hypothetical protein PM082_000037 [Marasmius tenuissimus]|nr:hypothetical protein PM082_000037 [Marasmius tenuissimus]
MRAAGPSGNSERGSGVCIRHPTVVFTLHGRCGYGEFIKIDAEKKRPSPREPWYSAQGHADGLHLGIAIWTIACIC